MQSDIYLTLSLCKEIGGNDMKKFKKIMAIGLSAIMALSILSTFAFASENAEEDTIYFVQTDKDGNVIDTVEPVYLDYVAEKYEQSKLMRWPSTTYYNLANGAYTMSGKSGAFILCTKRFNANSLGRLYFYGEVTGDPTATLDIYDVTNDKYQGSFNLLDQGNGTYMKNGYIVGLNTASNHYYSYGLGTDDGGFSSYYAAISWNAL